MTKRLVYLAAALSLFGAACASPSSSKTQTHKANDGPPRSASAIAAGAVPYNPADDSPVDTLTVNGETVHARDLWRDVRDMVAGAARSLSAGEFKTYVEREAATWITDKVSETLIYQRADALNPPQVKTNVERYVDSEIRRIITAEHGGVERRYEKHLAAKGLTFEEVRAKLLRTVTITAFLEAEVKPKIAEPTRVDLLAAYEANVESWRRPPRRKMSLIDVRVMNGVPSNGGIPSPAELKAARADARSRIASARSKVLGGADFAEVAGRHSDGLHKHEGGSWGWVKRGTVRERFEPAVEALFALEAGETSDIIEVDDGFLLVRCDEIDEGAEPSFQEVQPLLTERYTQVTYNRLIAELVAELHAKARIEPLNLDRFHAALVQEALRARFGED